jgi:hypothetical protein
MAGGAIFRHCPFRWLTLLSAPQNLKKESRANSARRLRIHSARPQLGDFTIVILAKRKPSSTFCQRALHRSRRSQPVASVLRIHSGATPPGRIHPTSQPQLSPQNRTFLLCTD